MPSELEKIDTGWQQGRVLLAAASMASGPNVIAAACLWAHKHVHTADQADLLYAPDANFLPFKGRTAPANAWMSDLEAE